MKKRDFRRFGNAFLSYVACLDERRNNVFDHDDTVHERGNCLRHTKTDEKLLEVYEEYLQERNRRKEEFDKWLGLEMKRNRDRNEFDCVQTKPFDLTLPRKTWRRISELAKQYDKTVDQVVSILVEATANRFTDFE